jgi:hypothetical protein
VEAWQPKWFSPGLPLLYNPTQPILQTTYSLTCSLISPPPPPSLCRIFEAESLKVTVISNYQLLYGIGVFLALDSVLLGTLTVLAPQGSVQLILLIVILVSKACMVVWGVVIAVRSRVVRVDKFKERQQLGYAIYNITVMALVILPMSFLFTKQYGTAYIIRSIGLMVVVTINLGILYLPKVSGQPNFELRRDTAFLLSDTKFPVYCAFSFFLALIFSFLLFFAGLHDSLPPRIKQLLVAGRLAATEHLEQPATEHFALFH